MVPPDHGRPVGGAAQHHPHRIEVSRETTTIVSGERPRLASPHAPDASRGDWKENVV